MKMKMTETTSRRSFANQTMTSDEAPTEAACHAPLGLLWRLTEKVSQERVTSEPDNSSQDDRGGADDHGDGNKGRGE